MPIITFCEECGKEIKMPPSQYKRAKQHFCSRKCHMKNMNRELNPKRMTLEVREKLSDIKRKKNVSLSPDTYEKTLGRHTHRIMAEQKIGRPLHPGEVVHHIDGDKHNNAPDNLMVFESQAEHARWHKLNERG